MIQTHNYAHTRARVRTHAQNQSQTCKWHSFSSSCRLQQKRDAVTVACTDRNRWRGSKPGTDRPDESGRREREREREREKRREGKRTIARPGTARAPQRHPPRRRTQCWGPKVSLGILTVRGSGPSSGWQYLPSRARDPSLPRAQAVSWFAPAVNGSLPPALRLLRGRGVRSAARAHTGTQHIHRHRHPCIPSPLSLSQ